MSIAILSRNKKPKSKQPKETLQQTALSCVFMFACVLIFHAIVFQPFQIPSGSMAPTLLGNHLRVTCDQCGYTFKLDSHLDKRYFKSEPPIVCPMCGAPNRIKDAQLSSGDRIIVQKFAYEFTDPKRWDVVVFKTPQYLTTLGGVESRGPVNDFIKRCIGLPNENLRIFDGNVYVQQVQAVAGGPYKPQGEYKIARKHHNEKAQRAMFVPIYHSRYVPEDGGKSSNRIFKMDGYRQKYYWSVPWVPNDEAASNWKLDERALYRYQGTGQSTLTFDFQKSNAYTIFSIYPYNQFRRPFSRQHPVEDIRLGLTAEPVNGAAEMTLSTTARWVDGLKKLSANIGKNGDVILTAANIDAQSVTELAKTKIDPITSATEIELWYIDQELSLWIDGEKVVHAEYDLPMQSLISRAAAPNTPVVSITVNEPIALRNVDLDRDLYYTSKPLNQVARGGLHREDGPTSPVTTKPTLELQDGEFFMVGDNTPWSNDSRFWDDTEPWLSMNYMTGDRERDRGIVPREMLVGKAMLVFWPSPFGWVPNFGDMRLIH